MQSTRQFLAAVRRALEAGRGETVSDYRLAKELGVTRSAMSRYLLGKNTFDERVAMRVAGVLELHPGYVAACIQAERAEREQSPERRQLWESVAGLLRGVALLLVAAAGATVALELTGVAGELAYLLPVALVPELTVIHIVQLSLLGSAVVAVLAAAILSGEHRSKVVR